MSNLYVRRLFRGPSEINYSNSELENVIRQITCTEAKVKRKNEIRLVMKGSLLLLFFYSEANKAQTDMYCHT